MCGLAGLFDMRGARPFAPDLMRAMTDVLAHRGPDGDGFYQDAGLAFGHRRLSIIDLAGGAQPMSLPDGNLTVILNGEIYNYKELRAALEAQGARFRTNSDTETLLFGWRIWGESVVERLRGMFVFAIWDRPQQTLFIARDRLGKKPLHYATLADGTLAFASEIKSLLQHPDFDDTLDPTAIDDYFAYGYVPDPKTIYTHARKLPPAHTLTAKRGVAPIVRRYWDIAEASAGFDGRDFCEEALRARLGEAVKLRLVSDVEVGAFLSGGVDSSAVVALMAGMSDLPVSTFSIGFGEQEFDESTYAARVAERYGTHHQIRRVAADSVSLLAKLPAMFDEPFGDSSAIPTYHVSAETSRFVKVCLSGDGGDEALAGYRRYAFHLAEERVRGALPAGLRKPLFGAAAALYPKLDWAPRWMRAKTTLDELARDSAEAYFQAQAMLPDTARRALYSADYGGQIAGYEARETMTRQFAAVPHLDALRQAQYADINLYLAGDILVKVDRTSMANSLEVRAPILDHEFMAWAFAMPARLKLANGQGKAILKRAMEPLLPKDLLYRAKKGFSVPLSRWLRSSLRERVERLGASRTLAHSGTFDMDRISARARAHLAGGQDHAKTLWLLLVFEAFLDHRKSRGRPITRRATGAPAGGPQLVTS